MSTHQSPDPLALTPIRVQGILTAIRGWTGVANVFAYTIEPDPAGKYLALIIDGTTGSIARSWTCNRRDEAIDLARQEYLAESEAKA
jgi:hypothetical protein